MTIPVPSWPIPTGRGGARDCHFLRHCQAGAIWREAHDSIQVSTNNSRAAGRKEPSGAGHIHDRLMIVAMLVKLAFHKITFAIVKGLSVVFVQRGFGFFRGSNEDAKRFSRHLAGELNDGLPEYKTSATNKNGNGIHCDRQLDGSGRPANFARSSNQTNRLWADKLRVRSRLEYRTGATSRSSPKRNSSFIPATFSSSGKSRNNGRMAGTPV